MPLQSLRTLLTIKISKYHICTSLNEPSSNLSTNLSLTYRIPRLKIKLKLHLYNYKCTCNITSLYANQNYQSIRTEIWQKKCKLRKVLHLKLYDVDLWYRLMEHFFDDYDECKKTMCDRRANWMKWFCFNKQISHNMRIIKCD